MLTNECSGQKAESLLDLNARPRAAYLENTMYRIDLSDCPDILELGLMAAADPDFIERAAATLAGGGLQEMNPGEGGGCAALQADSPAECVQTLRSARG